jgi:Cdc6-like AAA superfamily ATPase
MKWKRREQPETSAPASNAGQDAPAGAAADTATVEAQRDPGVPAPVAGSIALESRPSFLDRLWSGNEEQLRADTLPRFTASASDEVEISNDVRANRRKIALRDTMSASQPVIDREHFAGRHDALRQLITAVEQQRMHVVIYGERGIGKTSLAHVFAETAREVRYLVLYSSCGSDTKFDVMFRSFAARIPRLYHRSILPNSPEAESGGNFDSLLSDDFGPRELADLFAEVTATRVVLILDEFDRVADPAFRSDVAELIKNLSDRGSRVQLILTGVAQNLDELLGYAPSIRRNVIGLPLRPMSTAEITDLISIGEAAAELEFSTEAIELIVAMSSGSPYIVRLLTHQAGLIAIDSRSATVSETHAKAAVERVLTDWNATLPRRIQYSLGREEARVHWPLLIAAARAGTAADGFFSADDVNLELAEKRPVMQIERDLKGFVGAKDLLEIRTEGDDLRFRFRYPGVSALLLMSSAMAGLPA